MKTHFKFENMNFQLLKYMKSVWNFMKFLTVNYTECFEKTAHLNIRIAHAIYLTRHTASIKCIAASNDIMNILKNLSKTINHVVALHRVIGYCVEDNLHATSLDETTYCDKVSWSNCMKTLIWIVILPSAGISNCIQVRPYGSRITALVSCKLSTLENHLKWILDDSPVGVYITANSVYSE